MKELQFPLIKITLFFIFGIIFCYWFEPNFWVIVSLLLTTFVASIVIYRVSLKSFSTNFYYGITILLTSFFIGALALLCNNETRKPNHYIHKLHSSQDIHTSRLIVEEKLKNTAKNDRYSAEIYELDNHKSHGKIILNIRKNNTTPSITIGSHLEVKSTFYKNRSPNNPNQFDYGRYLENKQIYAQIYADASDIKMSNITEKSLSYYASKIRNQIIANLEKNNFGKSELSVINALILGQQQDISKEVVHDYQYAGAVHVLSVSGLHVGLILLFITYLLKPLPNTKTNLVLKLIITILFLWLFGILAGLAPSVIRSVTMFSFVAVGMFLRRSVNIYNTLMISVLLILLVEPSFIFDIGFQLSYIALFFIVWFQPLLSSIWSPKNKYVKSYFWDVITVSFAAQIGTLPLSIYYFHQFPLLFFITNIVILPAITFILALGVLVMMLAAFNIVWLPMMKLLEISIVILNKIINSIASWENFVIKDIPLTSYMMLCLYLLIISWIIWFKKPSFIKLVTAISAVIILQLTTFRAIHASEYASEFIVFAKSKTSIFTFRNGSNVNVFSNDSILKNIDDNLSIKSYLVANFCKLNKKESISNLYYFKGKKILVVDSSAIYLNDKKPDILILRNSPKISLDRVFKFWKPQTIVVDGSNYKSYVKIWEATCKKEKIPFHATAEKGFYKL